MRFMSLVACIRVLPFISAQYASEIKTSFKIIAVTRLLFFFNFGKGVRNIRTMNAHNI